MANQVYDPESGEEPTYRSPPGLGPAHNKPSGDTSDPRAVRKNPQLPEGGKEAGPSGSRDNLRDAESAGGGFFNPQEAGGTSDSLSAAETKPGGGSGNFSFNPDDKDPGSTFRKIKSQALKHKKGIAIGVGTGGGITAIIISLFFLLVPLKIEHIVTNLQDRFFASSNSAVEKETDRLLGRYIVNKVLPAYKACGTTISKDCSPKNFSDNPVGRLYRTWANARLENKLAENYGIEFKYNKTSNTWYLKAPGTSGAGDNIGRDGQGLNSDFRRSDRGEMRTAIRRAMDGETRWKQVMYRYKVGRLLEGKYGIKRCIMFCGTRDALSDNVKAKKIAAQLYITQRVITPRTESVGIVIECMLNPNCHPEDTDSKSISDEAGSPAEAENQDTDTKQREALQAFGATFPGTSAEKLTQNYDEISDKGFQKYLLEKAFAKIGFGRVSSQAADIVPILGEIKLAADIISFADRAGPAVMKIGYITNAAAAASTYMMYRTYADEVHTGHVNATEIGSMVDSLGPGNTGSTSDPEKGGEASAEQAPLYRNVIDGSPASKSNSNDYVCENGKPVPSGKLVCTEEVLGQGNDALNSTHEFLNLPVIGQVTALSNGVSGFFGTVGDLFGSVITSIPVLGGAIKDVSGLIGSIFQPLVDGIVRYLIPSPFGTNMSGGRKFDMMAAGADVSGNDYAHIGLGGQKLTPEQTASIINEQQTEASQDFSNQSLFARIFDTNSKYSLVSRVAMSVPLSKQAAAQSSIASLLNPISAASHGFGSILSGKANAALASQPDPFGVTQYGYPDGTIPDDPEAYWEAHCSDKSAQAYQNDADFKNSPGGKGWVGLSASGPPDDQTGMPVNTSTNPCLLIKATIGAAGGLFNTSNLTAYDLANQRNQTTPSASDITVSGDAQELAQEILKDPNIKLVGRYTTEDIQNTADGKPAYGSVKLDIGILQFLVDLGGQGEVYVSSITGAGSGHSPTSNHYKGIAIDIQCNGIGSQVGLLNQTAAKYNGHDNGELCDRPNPYGNPLHNHYDFSN